MNLVFHISEDGSEIEFLSQNAILFINIYSSGNIIDLLFEGYELKVHVGSMLF